MFASLFILIALVQGYDQPTLRPQQPRVTVIASHLIRTERPGDFSADGGLLRAERETAHRIESGLGLSEVATIGDGYATGICTQGATEYVLLMTAEVNPYPLYHDSSSAYPPVTDPPRRIFTHPRLRATLWRCPGILVQTAFIDSPRAPFEDIAVA